MPMKDQPEDKPAISFSYSRFREFYHLEPLTLIARIEVATGEKPTGTVIDRRGRRASTRTGAIWGTSTLCPH
jgi:hypothetical protein